MPYEYLGNIYSFKCKGKGRSFEKPVSHLEEEDVLRSLIGQVPLAAHSCSGEPPLLTALLPFSSSGTVSWSLICRHLMVEVWCYVGLPAS